MLNFLKLFLVLLIIINTKNVCLCSDEERREDRYSSFYQSAIKYEISDFYNSQLNFNFCYINDYGWYKNIKSKLLDLTYGLRFKDNAIEHKLRFVLIDYQGIFQKTLLDYGKQPNDSLIGEYLFHQFGIKVLDWNKLDYLNSDLNIFRLNYDLILENRVFSEEFLLPGPQQHNFYFIPSLYAGITNISLNSDPVIIKAINADNNFWDIEMGVNMELGYEYVYQVAVQNPQYGHIITYSYLNSIMFFLNYRNFILNSFISYSYGSKAIINLGDYFNFDLIYCENIFSYFEQNKKFHKFTISYNIPLFFQ